MTDSFDFNTSLQCFSVTKQVVPCLQAWTVHAKLHLMTDKRVIKHANFLF